MIRKNKKLNPTLENTWQTVLINKEQRIQDIANKIVFYPILITQLSNFNYAV
jgi:hypothetical protein